ncbi:TVP38/TMEM64 family protein [Metapseudomonas furukawaii]|uniref:TVP38/TMEM64 family membrane protein n=1 Tax=Metapseudomonas furukawaii TaxID=1149133 RepID=A0AAD1BYK2_METFU|nr:VTT domain-containing protein [Pseudomonas furukawaii]BAU74254.1 membrane protein, putative [Pseudomonas furukawaii]
MKDIENEPIQWAQIQHSALKPEKRRPHRRAAMMTPRMMLKGLGLILSLALIGYLFDSSDLGNAVNEAWIDAHVRGRGMQGTLLFLAMGTLFTAAGLPRQIIAFLAGYAFGLIPGTLLGALAALLGCVATFLFARLFGRSLLRDRLSARAVRYDRFIHAHPFSMTLLIRLLPVGSNILTNLVAGLSSASLAPFLAASFIGFLPQTLVFALVGSGINVAPTLRIGLAAALLLGSGMLGTWLYHRHSHGLGIDDRVDAALGEMERP